jgi:serine/threonine protein kinase
MDRIIAIDHFSEKDAAAVTADVLNAIHYLHNIGITHRDLKVFDQPSISFGADTPTKWNFYPFLDCSGRFASRNCACADTEERVPFSPRTSCMRQTTPGIPTTIQSRLPTLASQNS